jgi:hypothetical protein
MVTHPALSLLPSSMRHPGLLAAGILRALHTIQLIGLCFEKSRHRCKILHGISQSKISLVAIGMPVLTMMPSLRRNDL